MKVEIWSDVMCPFCYIGKRHFEKALEMFSDDGQLEIEWKSFQLDPTIPEITDKNFTINEYLSTRKGISKEQLEQMNSRVVEMAEAVGLEYHLDRVLVTNSFKTHRIIQLSKEKGIGDVVEEKFFYAYFTDNKDLGDDDVLLDIGKEIGLMEHDIREALTEDEYAYKVKEDIKEAQQIGVSGVPFFVFDRKYAVSGAQPTAVFLQTLKQSFEEWKEQSTRIALSSEEGDVCTPDGGCR